MNDSNDCLFVILKAAADTLGYRVGTANSSDRQAIVTFLVRTRIGLMVVKETTCFGVTKGLTFSTFRLEMT